MGQNNAYIFLWVLSVLLILISGCTQISESGLLSKLNTNVANYAASYKIEHEVHGWAGHSGSTDFTDESNISIVVSNGRVANYSERKKREGHPIDEEDYLDEYDNLKNNTCRKQHTQTSKCDSPMGLPSDSAKLGAPFDWMLPEFKQPLMGCRLRQEGSCTDVHVCMINGKAVQLYDDYSQEVNTLEFTDIWQDKSRWSGWGCYYVKYYPQTKKGLCIYELRDVDGGMWAVPCKTDLIELKPLIDNVNDLKNLVCHQKNWNDCECEFDYADTVYCYEKVPNNFDDDSKSRILNYLILNHLKGIMITTISEEDNEKGHCYSFYYNNLDHIFCFDKQNLLTYAQWGRNIHEERSTSVDITKIEKI